VLTSVNKFSYFARSVRIAKFGKKMIRTFFNGLFSLDRFGSLEDVKLNVKLYLEVVNVVIDVVVVKWRDLKVQEEVSKLIFKTSDFEA
jgi:hypothetical protein